MTAGAPVSVCIIDIHMPDMDGYELAAKIRAFAKKGQSPIEDMGLIAVSSAITKNVKEFEKAGFDVFLRKPIPKERFFKAVETVLTRQKKGHPYPRESVTQKPREQPHKCREEENAVRVLIVEDNRVNQKLARMMLNKAGYHAGIANNGKEAVKIYTQVRKITTLILMDIQMPEWTDLKPPRQFDNLKLNIML